MLLISIVVYLVFTVLLGYWASRRVKTASDFLLAGRNLPVFLSSAALFATWFGSETVFGASAQFLEGGLYAVIEDPFGAALCLVLFGMFFARKLYGMNLLTLGDFFRQRFGRQSELTAGFFLAPPYVGYIAAQLVAMGLILNAVAGLEIWQGIVASALVVTAYTFIGGMWAISITDFVQGIIIVCGLVVLAFVMGKQAGGIGHVLNEMEPGTLKFWPAPQGKEIITYLAAWSVLGLGSIPSQDVFQRAMSSGSSAIAVRSCYIAAALYLTVAMLPLFISLCARILYAGHLPGDLQLALPNMVLMHTALPVQVLFFGSLLSAIMSTTSSAILAPAAIFSENLVKPLLGHRLTDSQLLGTTRVAILLFSALGTVMACLRSNIYELVSESSVLSLVSLFSPLAFGLYWKKANGTGAISAMVAGMLSWIFFEWLYPLSVPSLVPSGIISIFFMVAGSWVRRFAHKEFS